MPKRYFKKRKYVRKQSSQKVWLVQNIDQSCFGIYSGKIPKKNILKKLKEDYGAKTVGELNEMGIGIEKGLLRKKINGLKWKYY